MVIARNVNSKWVERVVATEHRCWENAQYSSRDTLGVVGITMSVRDNVLEQKVCGVFQKIGVDMCNRHIQACHRLKDKDRAIVKSTNRKDCLRILRVKRQLKGLDPAAVDWPEGTKIFVNESLFPYYRGIWSKCKKLRGKQKVHQHYPINGLIRLRMEEYGQAKMITHMVDLKICSPISKLIDCSCIFYFILFIYLFFIFAGEIPVVFLLQSFVIFIIYLGTIFVLLFLPFWIFK